MIGRAGAINRVLGPLCVKAVLVARGLRFSDAILQHGVGEIGDTVLDRIVEPLEFGVSSDARLRNSAMHQASPSRSMIGRLN